MRFDKKYQIEKAVSTDETRYALGYVHIADDGKHLVATNGRMLAMVPVELDASDDVGNAAIPPTVLVEARKKAGKRRTPEVKLNGTFQHEDGVSVPRPTHEETGHYPNYQQIIPENPAIKLSVTFNPEMLLALAKALGDSKRATLEFQDLSGNPAIIVRNGEAMGLLMPIKTEPQENSNDKHI